MREDGTLDRRAVVAALLREPGDMLVVTGLGSTTYDAGAAGDRKLNFYLWGAMGGAVAIGLGLALAQRSRRVLVVTGDGEMLMGLGALATAGARGLPNLSVAVIDNGRFGETGQQVSHTALGTDLAAVARACGWTRAETVLDMEGVERVRPALRSGPVFAVVRVAPGDAPRFLPPRDGGFLTRRFRTALGLSPD
jgi:thiamine pyrophosphate-dependent acetolactate synthase large subunit-like protein